MRREHLIHVTMTVDEKRRLDEEAAKRGVSRAAVLRAGVVLMSGRLPKPLTDAPVHTAGSPATHEVA